MIRLLAHPLPPSPVSKLTERKPDPINHSILAGKSYFSNSKAVAVTIK
jgi:hypothetical protein